jgi:uncharacterized membrane protein
MIAKKWAEVPIRERIGAAVSLIFSVCLLMTMIGIEMLDSIEENEFLSNVFVFALILVIIIIYFAPSFIAYSRNHLNRQVIYIINFLAGWTFVGWMVALVWSLMRSSATAKEKGASAQVEKQEHLKTESPLAILKKRFAEGEITEAEFRRKKELLK